MISGTQRRTFAWPIRNWICLSNGVIIGSGSAIPPYTPERDRPTATDEVDRKAKRGEPV
jgi:hypothetical protein